MCSILPRVEQTHETFDKEIARLRGEANSKGDTKGECRQLKKLQETGT